MNIDLMQTLYTVVMVIVAFLGAVIITKTISKYLKLDDKIKDDES
ncbi:hypothetical protein MNB_SV-5-898 [hydrothermal vent metagenome]|uniref:Uncharacterized protein n=1 Tax=hydrothermal vent metagenome TaxID=652676 RepID=A0A1W1EG22_9ZZZZ